jgi:hypothetical protein
MKIAFVLSVMFFILISATPTLSQGRPFQGCIITLEPIQDGEQFSRVQDRRCFDSVSSYQAALSAANYKITDFYDWTDYVNLIATYLGPQPCSAGYSYGVPNVGSSLNDRFESATTGAGCNNVTVFENANYGGARLPCNGLSTCNTFGLLNNRVTSWTASP